MDSTYSALVNMEIQIIQDVMISRYFTAAALVLVMYDATITIDDEVRLVWSGPFAVPKLLYYVNRYWTIASLIAANYLVAGFRPPLSTTFCRYLFFVGAIAEIVADMASSAILILRVAALYETKWVGRSLWILSGLLYIITIVSSVTSLKSFYNKFVYEPLSGVCLSLDMSSNLYAPFALPLIFDAALVILTAFKICRLAAELRKQSGTEILRIIFRDGVIYFIIVVALRIWNSIIWVALPHSFMYLGIYSYWAMLSTMTSRLFLNLRSAGSSTPNLPQIHSVDPGPLGNGQPSPLESTQVTSSRTLTTVNFDSTLSAMISGVDRSAFTDQEQGLSWDAAETKPSEGCNGDVESQPRVG